MTEGFTFFKYNQAPIRRISGVYGLPSNPEAYWFMTIRARGRGRSPGSDLLADAGIAGEGAEVL